MTKKLRADLAVDQLGKITEEVEELFLKESLKLIKERTPVDTGAARNGWEIKSGDIVNGVDHVKYLEFGTKNMRPVAMVRRTAIESKQILDRVVKKVGDGK